LLHLADKKLKTYASQGSLECLDEEFYDKTNTEAMDPLTSDKTENSTLIPSAQKSYSVNRRWTGKSTGSSTKSSKSSTRGRRGCCPVFCGRGGRRRGQTAPYGAQNLKRGASSDSVKSGPSPAPSSPMRPDLSMASKASSPPTPGKVSRGLRFMGMREKDSNGPAAQAQQAMGATASVQSAQSMKSAQSVKSTMTTATSVATASPSPRQVPKAPEIAERHMKRFERFLAEVKKNPQRLVKHVEDRRAEKTLIAYIVGPP